MKNICEITIHRKNCKYRNNSHTYLIICVRFSQKSQKCLFVAFIHYGFGKHFMKIESNIWIFCHVTCHEVIYKKNFLPNWQLECTSSHLMMPS